MKLDKRHMRVSIVLMVGAVIYNIWAFTATGRKAAVPQATAPIQAVASAQPTSGGGGRMDPSQVKALPDVAADRVPVWPRNPFQNPHPPEVVEVVEEAAPPAPIPEPDPVVASILYSPDRKAAVVDGHIVRIGDAIGASQVVDILPKAVIVDSPVPRPAHAGVEAAVRSRKPQMKKPAPRPGVAAAAQAARAKLLVVLPLTMALLVGSTGFFVLSMASRLFAPGDADATAAASDMVAQLSLQIASISVIAALLGLSIAMGVTRPVRQVTEQLEALASGDLRGALRISSTKELDSLGGALNDALSAVQRYIFQSMTGAVITLDAEGRVIGSSAAAEATLGYREEDLVGRRFSEVFTPASGSRASLAAVETAIARREPVSLDDMEILTADGRPVRIGVSASYLQQGPGSAGTQAREIVGVTIAFKDLNQMRSLQARLQQADQLMALGTVTAGVAHEIRNPLASLRGLAELLGRDIPDGDNRRRYVDTMLRSIDRLNRLIEDLLLFSSPRAAETEVLDIVGTVAETVSLAQVGVTAQPVTLTNALSPDQPLIVRGNRERLIQVLTNIVLNATQATPDGGAVTVRTEQRDALAIVSVHNTGSYIPTRIRRQLFVPFFTTKPTGTGLGLAIARQIVMSMDGRIDVQSDPDSGTTFTVELPLAAKDQPMAALAG